MRTASLFIPGQFQDAQLYMGQLVAWTEDRTMRVYPLRELTAAAGARMGRASSLAPLLFERNDWLSSEAVGAILSPDTIRRSLVRLLADVPAPYIELNPSDLTFSEWDIDIEGDALLDTSMYNGRIYVATSAGLFDADPTWNDDDFELGSFRRRHDARCVHTYAKYGAINASCEEEGLFTAFDEFGWLEGMPGNGFRRTADRSLRTTWWRSGLLNYRTAVGVELLSAHTERFRGLRGSERETTVVTDLEPERDMDIVLDALRIERDVEADRVQFIWNSASVFFVNTLDQGLFTVRLEAAGDEFRYVKASIRSHAEVSGRVLSVSSTPVGVVLESDNSVAVFSDGKMRSLVNEEAISVRTFMQSKRYRNLVAVTIEDGILLTALVQFD